MTELTDSKKTERTNMSLFNLLYEPWIKVLEKDNTVSEVSIKELFQNAKKYMVLVGENRLQDVAILRLLSAIAVTMLYKYDDNGNPSDLRKKTKREIISICKNIWDNGLPEKMMSAFCNEWEDRFYLFDDEHPFMQIAKDRFVITNEKPNKPNPIGYKVVTESEKGICPINYLKAKTWVGTILESGNSKSPFSNYINTDNLKLSYAEAARWLVWVLNFSSCAIKNRKYFNAKLPWAGKGALISPVGQNLHETIILNSVLLFRGDGDPYEEIHPIWERETTPVCTFFPYGENGHPNNLPELYTQQSRKVRLYAESGVVTGMFAVSGDDYDSKNAFGEPMFMWKNNINKKTQDSWMSPTHRSDTAPVWKEVSSIIPSEGNNKPGVVRWVGFLYENDIIDPDKVNIPYQITDIVYGNTNCVIQTTIEDELIINKKYFNPNVAMEFEDVISITGKISDAVYIFAKELALSQGTDKKRLTTKAQKVKLRYEADIGTKVLDCLEGIIEIRDLQKMVFDEANKIINDMIEKVPISAYIGHGDYTLAKAEKKFKIKMNNLRKKVLPDV